MKAPQLLLNDGNIMNTNDVICTKDSTAQPIYCSIEASSNALLSYARDRTGKLGLRVVTKEGITTLTTYETGTLSWFKQLISLFGFGETGDRTVRFFFAGQDAQHVVQKAFEDPTTNPIYFQFKTKIKTALYKKTDAITYEALMHKLLPRIAQKRENDILNSKKTLDEIVKEELYLPIKNYINSLGCNKVEPEPSTALPFNSIEPQETSIGDIFVRVKEIEKALNIAITKTNEELVNRERSPLKCYLTQ